MVALILCMKLVGVKPIQRTVSIKINYIPHWISMDKLARAINHLKEAFSYRETVSCSIWLRHQLANFKYRLKVLETRFATEGLILSGSQFLSLEKKKFDVRLMVELKRIIPVI
jgi:hypothetical protein